MAPAPPVAADYTTPVKFHPMIQALGSEHPESHTAVRALCQPFLAAAQPSLNSKGAKSEGGPAMTYGRLVLAQRAYLRELDRGAHWSQCVTAARDAYRDKPNWNVMNAPVNSEVEPTR